MSTAPSSRLPNRAGAPPRDPQPILSEGAIRRVDKTDHRLRGEVLRKALHISPGFFAFLLPLVPHSRPLSTQSLVEITLLTAFFTGAYVALRRRVARQGEQDFYLTALSYPAAVLGTLYLFPQAPELAAVAVAVIAFGDGAACIAGRLIGGARLSWNSAKTWAGTISFVAVAAPLATLAYLGAAPTGTPWMAGLVCGVGAAVAGSIAESLPTQVSDNLRVGVSAALAVTVLHFGMAALGTPA